MFPFLYAMQAYNSELRLQSEGDEPGTFGITLVLFTIFIILLMRVKMRD